MIIHQENIGVSFFSGWNHICAAWGHCYFKTIQFQQGLEQFYRVAIIVYNQHFSQGDFPLSQTLWEYTVSVPHVQCKRLAMKRQIPHWSCLRTVDTHHSAEGGRRFGSRDSL